MVVLLVLVVVMVVVEPVLLLLLLVEVLLMADCGIHNTQIFNHRVRADPVKHAVQRPRAVDKSRQPHAHVREVPGVRHPCCQIEAWVEG